MGGLEDRSSQEPDSIPKFENTFLNEEIGGLPIPPLEDFAFLDLPPLNQLDLSENFFDGIRDDICESRAKQYSSNFSLQPKKQSEGAQRKLKSTNMLLGSPSIPHVQIAVDATGSAVQPKSIMCDKTRDVVTKSQSKTIGKQMKILKSVLKRTKSDMVLRKVEPKRLIIDTILKKDKQNDRRGSKLTGCDGATLKKKMEATQSMLRDSYRKYETESKRKIQLIGINDVPMAPPKKKGRYIGKKTWPTPLAIH